MGCESSSTHVFCVAALSLSLSLSVHVLCVCAEKAESHNICLAWTFKIKRIFDSPCKKPKKKTEVQTFFFTSRCVFVCVHRCTILARGCDPKQLNNQAWNSREMRRTCEVSARWSRTPELCTIVYFRARTKH